MRTANAARSKAGASAASAKVGFAHGPVEGVAPPPFKPLPPTQVEVDAKWRDQAFEVAAARGAGVPVRMTTAAGSIPVPNDRPRGRPPVPRADRRNPIRVTRDVRPGGRDTVANSDSGRLLAGFGCGLGFCTPMYSRPNAASLAARIRSLVGPTDRASLRRLACDLGVHDSELREILEYQTPYPSASVLAAIVAVYGVDAGWLLTGEYSPSTHRAEEEAKEPSKSRVARVLDDLRSPGPLP